MDELKAFIGVLFLVFLWITTTRDNEFVTIKVVLHKFQIVCHSISFSLLSKDSKGVGMKYNTDPSTLDTFNAKKTIIFIRHGESDWNNVFNKGINLSFPMRLIQALIDEFKILFKADSKFIDSPLNEEGLQQAFELREVLEASSYPSASDDMRVLFDVIKGNSSSSVIVSSNLRRAVATTTVSLWDRLQRKNEKILILSCLQEISNNIDTISMSAPRSIADLPFDRLLPYCKSIGPFDPSKLYNCSENTGNKTKSFNGGKRIQSFCKWVFQRKEEVIIVGGHSLWFKSFFQTFIPFNCDHDAKKLKITNSGVVSFTLYRGEDDKGGSLYRIEPDTITVLSGGFTRK